MDNAFKIDESAHGNTVILRIHGSLDAKSTPLLVARSQRLRGEEKHLVLNLSQVVFIASSGVGGLLALMEEFTSSGLTLKLVELSTAVSSVIKLLNLDRFMSIVAREGDAIASMKS